MNKTNDAIEAVLNETDRLRRSIKGRKSPQVRSSEERSLVKATALSWFNTHRKEVLRILKIEQIDALNNLYKELLTAADRATSRAKYDTILKTIREQGIELRVHAVLAPENPIINPTTDEPPKFDLLIGDARMRNILIRRWQECFICSAAGAPLASTVMMGGLLEALLLARVNKETNKAPIFKATKAPKEKITGKTLSLNEWTLRHYIDVAHELGWISQSAKDIGEVLRDYRNYVHPYKELSHGINLSPDDSNLFWEICKSIAKQVTKS